MSIMRKSKVITLSIQILRILPRQPKLYKTTCAQVATSKLRYAKNHLPRTQVSIIKYNFFIFFCANLCVGGEKKLNSTILPLI